MNTPKTEGSAALNYPLRGDDLCGMAAIIIAEYDVLRGEIGRYQDHQKQIMNFVFLVVAAMFSVAAAALSSTTRDVISAACTIVLFFPIVFTLLACLYSDRTLRIIRLANYIHNHLRYKAKTVCGERVWQWETYKGHTQIFNRKLALMLDKARWLVFVLPSGVAMGLFFTLPRPAIHTELGVLLALDACAIVGSVAIMFLTEETTGVQSRSDVDLDTLERLAEESAEPGMLIEGGGETLASTSA